MVDDVIALENVSHDPAVRDMAGGPAAVALLWEMCQIPDYRKISAASHAELVATLYRFVMSDEGKIPADWFATQVALADRTDGDLDTLSNRLAQIRTWTFVSHHAEWLDDPEHWQGRTRAIEDTLSDALHERLTQRFVDRRTSVLMRRLRDKEEIAAEIGADGKILVENHYVGRLDGFRFTPDASSDGIHGRATRHAAAKVLAGELADRADALAAAPDEAIALKANGRIVWAGSEIARLEKGETALKPRIALFADEHLAAADRERVQKRLEAWLDAELRAKIAPLIVLSEASDLSGLARGLAYQLTENLGVLRRETASAEIKALDQAARAQLRKYGVAIRRLQRLYPGAAQARRGRSGADAVGAPFRSRARHRRGRAARAPATGADLGRGGQRPRALLARGRVPCRGHPRGAHRHAGAAVRPHSRAHRLSIGRRRRRRRRPARPGTAASAWCPS